MDEYQAITLALLYGNSRLTDGKEINHRSKYIGHLDVYLAMLRQMKKVVNLKKSSPPTLAIWECFKKKKLHLRCYPGLSLSGDIDSVPKFKQVFDESSQLLRGLISHELSIQGFQMSSERKEILVNYIAQTFVDFEYQHLHAFGLLVSPYEFLTTAEGQVFPLFGN